MCQFFWRLSLVLIVTCSFAVHSRTAVAGDNDSDLDWDPERTHVFVVGLLQWQDTNMWPSFPAAMKDRRDKQLVDYFHEAGVPKGQVKYLCDAEATKHRIEQEFVKLLGETDKGDLLIFYFAGHGWRDTETNQTYFANYDAGAKTSSSWDVRGIFATIEKHFGGNRALLLADCCHSGALYDQARKHRDSKIAYAVLTSSYAHNTSTGNWTFSDSLLAGLRGEPVVDLNGDEVIELDELARYTELELAFIEGQKSMFLANDHFPRGAVLADVEGEIEPRVGLRVEVKYEGKWYKAKVIDVDGDQVEVHYTNFDDSFDEWVGPDRVRPYAPAQYAEGDKVETCSDSDGQWYPGTVRKAWYGLHLIRYDGYDETSDEWLGPKSIRLRQE
jgi:hypothetical protein